MAAPGDVIRVLDDDVVDRIAAGEVLERPASALKELLENAFDAGAGMVEAHLEDGGLLRLTVSDDGCGMSPTDARRAVLRHATSKLRRAEDLFNIASYGFRGEALSSIAAVSRLTITTRRPGDAAGTRVTVHGGTLVEAGEVGCPEGTTVDVRDLFFNTPARKKFMRSPATEQAHAGEAALRVALGARRGGLVLWSGTRRLVDVPAAPQAVLQAAPEAARRVLAALGARLGTLYPVAHEGDGVRVSGFVTRPELDRADAKGLWLFVNGRYVRDRMLQRAVLDGYRGMVERGRYPNVILWVDLDPSALDVNVHPQKLEVRFGDSAAVFRAVAAGLVQVLSRSPWLGDGDGEGEGGGAPAATRYGEAARLPVRWLAEGGAAAYAALPAVPEAGLPELGFGAGYFSRLRPLGQVLRLYLVCAGEEGLVLIDQHAAHERVAFERLRRQAAEGVVQRQQLLFPEIVDLPPSQLSVLEERAAELLRYGVEVEPVGPGRFAVRAVPAALEGSDAAALVRDLLDELLGLGDVPGTAGKDAEARILSRCACHAVVRAGDALDLVEARSLLVALDEVDFGANCPHGRPVYHVLSEAELGRFFHRLTGA